MSTYQVDNIQLANNILDSTDPSKRLKLSLANITTGTTRTLTVPNSNTTIVGDNIAQTLTNKTLTAPIISTISNTGTLTLPTTTTTLIGTNTTNTLTNKTITDTTNNVTASGLRTATTTVAISTATAPTSGQILTATSSTAATWQNPNPFSVTLNNNGTITNPAITSLKQWYGRAISVSGITTFNVTTDGTSGGTAVFPTLSETSHYFQATGQLNTTSNTAVPFVSVQTVTNNKVVTVNVKTGDAGAILIGGNWSGLKNANDGCNVYLYIIGV